LKKAFSNKLTQILFILFPLLSGLLVTGPGDLQADSIASGESLTLVRAVEIGLKNHPSILAGVSTIRVNEAKVGEARAPYYPQVSLTETYLRSNPASKGGNSVTSAPGPLARIARPSSLSCMVRSSRRSSARPAGMRRMASPLAASRRLTISWPIRTPRFLCRPTCPCPARSIAPKRIAQMRLQRSQQAPNPQFFNRFYRSHRSTMGCSRGLVGDDKSGQLD